MTSNRARLVVAGPTMVTWTAALLLGGGCSSPTGEYLFTQRTGSGGAPSQGGTSGGFASDAAGMVASGGSGGVFVMSGGAGSAQGGGSGGGVTEGGSWCAALSVLHDHCRDCHDSTPSNAAPMSLVTFADLLAPSKSDPSQPVYRKVQERIADPQQPMPPLSTGDALTADEKAVIDAWVNAGATAPADASCDHDPGADETGGAGGTGGGETAWPEDCEQHYRLVAHGRSAANDTNKFDVSAAGTGKQWYQCFFFKAPWGTDAVQALAFRPIIDNSKVVHHWILYGADSGQQSDGQVGGSSCSNGVFINGWSPGGKSTSLPPDVGLQLPKGNDAVLALEIHYNNEASLNDALDASGVEFCTTKNLRQNTAAVHRLGTTNLAIPPHQTANFTNTCDPDGTAPVHILSISPYMHGLGTHSKVVLKRASGVQETLLDQPFFVDDQSAIPVDTVVNSGDSLTSTCTYNNTTDARVTFGPNTEDEACFMFTTAYPAGALTMGLSFLQPNRCISTF